MAILYEQVLRILLAVALGALAGFEREQARKPAGLRTHVLVCTGAALFTMVSIDYFGMDPARIAAGIVTGIGFLGAGTIIGSGSKVRGLTTAASLWVVAGIGLAVGAGVYVLSILTTIIVVLVLYAGRYEKEPKKA